MRTPGQNFLRYDFTQILNAGLAGKINVLLLDLVARSIMFIVSSSLLAKLAHEVQAGRSMAICRLDEKRFIFPFICENSSRI